MPRVHLWKIFQWFICDKSIYLKSGLGPPGGGGGSGGVGCYENGGINVSMDIGFIKGLSKNIQIRINSVSVFV